LRAMRRNGALAANPFHLGWFLGNPKPFPNVGFARCIEIAKHWHENRA